MNETEDLVKKSKILLFKTLNCCIQLSTYESKKKKGLGITQSDGHLHIEADDYTNFFFLFFKYSRTANVVMIRPIRIIELSQIPNTWVFLPII